MSNIILLDMLGKDGKDKVKGIKQSREKTPDGEQLKIDHIYHAVTYFEHRMSQLRATLLAHTQWSIDKTYVHQEYSWKNDYDEIMRRKQCKHCMA